MLKKKKSPYRPDGSFRPQTWKRPTYPPFDREKHRVLNMIRKMGLTDDEVLAKLAERGLSITKTTLYNWRLGYKFGGTRYPAGWRLHALAEALGFPYVPIAAADVASLKSAEVFDDLTQHEHKPRRRKGRRQVATIEVIAPVRVPVNIYPSKRPVGRPKGSKNKAPVAIKRPVGRPARQAA